MSTSPPPPPPPIGNCSTGACTPMYTKAVIVENKSKWSYTLHFHCEQPRKSPSCSLPVVLGPLVSRTFQFEYTDGSASFVNPILSVMVHDGDGSTTCAADGDGEIPKSYIFSESKTISFCPSTIATYTITINPSGYIFINEKQ